ncbi:MAG: HPr family phosphocarrier protein [Hungatella sp.]|nr:HPr family phosphocarrier protein [Hungatella sp.]
MKSFSYTITDNMGLHAQPAGYLTKLAQSFPCRITIIQGSRRADAKKLFGILGLGVKCRQEIILEAEGDQEDEAAAALREFLERNL